MTKADEFLAMVARHRERQLNDDLRQQITNELDEAESKAWDSLGRYKFQMFGYWAAIWVHLNRIGGFKRPNPWASLVKSAREETGGHLEQSHTMTADDAA